MLYMSKTINSPELLTIKISSPDHKVVNSCKILPVVVSTMLIAFLNPKQTLSGVTQEIWPQPLIPVSVRDFRKTVEVISFNRFSLPVCRFSSFVICIVVERTIKFIISNPQLFLCKLRSVPYLGKASFF